MHKSPERLKLNKWAIGTLSILVISIIGYVFLYFNYAKKIDIAEFFSVSADYVAIASCILVLVQVVAFVKDARLKEARAKKEYALNLAKEYASEILCNMSFIKNVLIDYYKTIDDKTVLDDLVKSIKLERFTNDELKKHKSLIEYSKIFDAKDYSLLSVKLVSEKAIAFQNIKLFEPKETLENIPESDLKKIANIRFKVVLCNTMNILEYFAMSVNQNVAESEMIFVSLHQTFLSFVHYVYPYICVTNETEESYYTNIIELYKNWNAQKEAIDDYKRKMEQEKDKGRKKIVKGGEPL